MQPPLAQPNVDRIITEAEIPELSPLHHPMLPPRQLRYRRVPSPLRLPFAVV